MTSETPARTAGIHLAQVVDDRDPMSLNRIQVHLVGLGLTLWAPVLIPGGGVGYGVALMPRREETVAVAFAGGDLGNPVVLGALWSGARARPPAAGAPGESYAIVSPGGAVIRVGETGEAPDPTIVVQSDDRTGIRIDAGSDARIQIEHPSGSITIDTDGIAVTSVTAVSVAASTVKISAGSVTIDAATTKASGVVECDTLIANSVVGGSYTPGPGNVW